MIEDCWRGNYLIITVGSRGVLTVKMIDWWKSILAHRALIAKIGCPLLRNTARKGPDWLLTNSRFKSELQAFILKMF